MSRLTSIIILLLCCAHSAFSQIIPFKNYTVREGLPSNYVSDIVQDQKGYMWMTTDNGLTKFDGYNFKNYTIEDGLSDNYTNCLTVDKNDNIWVGTETGGVSKITEFNIETYDESKGLFAGAIDLIFSDKQNNIWACGRQDGISIISKDSITTFTIKDSDLTSNVFSYHVGHNGTVWIGTYNGIYFFDDDLKHLKHPLLEDLIVWDIITDQYNRLWIASQDNGVFCYDGEVVLQYNTSNGLTTNTTLALLEDNTGRILVGTYDGGINIIENSVVKHDLVENTEDFWIWDLHEDSKGRIWARTDENGILLINSEVINYSEQNNLISSFVNGMYEDSFNNIWFITKDGLSIYGKSIFENYNKNFVDDNNNILSLFVDKQNTIYAGSYNGLTKIIDKQNYEVYNSENGLPDENASVFKIIPDGINNGVWLATNGLSLLKNNVITHYQIDEMIQETEITRDIATINETIYGATEIGLYILSRDTGKYKILRTDNGLIDNDIYTIDIDPEGNIWCGTSSGLSIFDGNNFYNYTVQDGLPNNFCNDITFDLRGVAWIATDYGLCSAVLDKNYNLSTRNYGVHNGLSSNSIVSVIADKLNNIWIGHDRGIDMLNIIDKSINHYGYNEGFLPIECNLGAIALDSKNNVWFGTINGVVKHSSYNDYKNTQPPKIFIKGISLYNDTSSIESFYTKMDSTTTLPKDLRFHYKKNSVFFNYVGLHYTIVEKNSYKYRLLGYDNKWSEPTTSIQSIPYQRLPHGKYTFQVKAANCDGIWTEKPAEFSFEILPPFWKTWWFRLIEISGSLLILYLIIFLRERKLRYDKKVLTQKVKERTVEIEKQKDQIEEQHDKISKQKKEITDSIQYAKHIQSAVLPKDETISPLLKDYFILYKPRDIVSGDFYWVNGYKDKVIVLAADCTGHGVPGAFMSMLGVSILNEIATEQAEPDAGKILDSLREHIIATLSHTEKDEEARDGMDLAMCILDHKENKIQYAGAYNPLILIRDNEAIVYKADKMPVGTHFGTISNFKTNEITIQQNDCLYMFSDGYADQFGGPEGKKLKSGPFRKLLTDINEKPMPEQKQILDDIITDWMKDYEQIDDILVLGIRIV